MNKTNSENVLPTIVEPEPKLVPNKNEDIRDLLKKTEDFEDNVFSNVMSEIEIS